MKPPDNSLIYNTEAIVIRKMDYGEHDLILTLLTRHKGKLTVMAKNAMKSVKRFSGLLELFYALDIVILENSRMAYIQEASLAEPFEGISRDILKTAYASYLAETVNRFLEEGARDEGIYDLLFHALGDLSTGRRTPEEASLFFQIKFLGLTGHTPELSFCLSCRKDLDDMDQVRVFFDIEKGGILCRTCGRATRSGLELTKGALKQLAWFSETEAGKASVIRFSKPALLESLRFVERFLPHHLEKELLSLKFLNTIRNAGQGHPF
jgi:DNA repair protein RecO (recombination protein O)